VTGHRQRQPQDPLRVGERAQIIEEVLEIPCIELEQPLDKGYVRERLEALTPVTVVTANPATAAFVTGLGFPVEKLSELGRLVFSGERVRERAREDRPWRHLVGGPVADRLDRLCFEEVLEDV